VRLATMLVRVIGRDKKPIPDLRPEDFQVFVSGQEVPVYAVDWSPAGSPSGTEPGKAETDTAQPEAPQAVIFVDAAIGHKTYVWIRDHLSLRPRLRELLASLPPRTRIAVVALRSRLEIWQDFTQDREAVYQAITRALYLNGKPGPLTERSTDPASLTAHFDFEAADRAIRHVPALTETVEALVPFSGVKSIFYLGANFDWHPWLYWKKKEASSIAEALRQARASVFVLDTRGSSYSRGVNNLPTLGRVGGGGIFYAGELGDLGLVAEVSSGYYILTFDVDTLPRSGHFIVKLRGKKGEVLVPPVKIDLAFQKEESR
ncbi:MAG TPA: VWA domain-containing protein, partial [Thermoanaerobaculia bacterium]|nr:VWA domain-containing protein [Thermoanaerobaculia bacterium]